MVHIFINIYETTSLTDEVFPPPTYKLNYDSFIN